MEQTSSSAYPNILVVDYVKKARVASSTEFLMKAEQYLNAGYQRLLTFEHKAGVGLQQRGVMVQAPAEFFFLRRRTLPENNLFRIDLRSGPGRLWK